MHLSSCTSAHNSDQAFPKSLLVNEIRKMKLSGRVPILKGSGGNETHLMLTSKAKRIFGKQKHSIEKVSIIDFKQTKKKAPHHHLARRLCPRPAQVMSILRHVSANEKLPRIADADSASSVMQSPSLAHLSS